MIEINKIDDFHYHEALDRTHLLLSNIDDFLLDHPIFKKHKKMRKQIEQASELLSNVYQEIGKKYIK